MASTHRPLGRPRSNAIDGALFRAAFELVASEGYGRLTIERIAAVSGVSKASIYRRFRSRAELVADALLANYSIVPAACANPVGGVERYLRRIFAAVRNQAGPMLQGLMADAQLEPGFRAIFRERFIHTRRAALADAIEAEYCQPANLDLLLDFALGTMWYRLLVGHGTLNDRDAAEIARALARLVPAEAIG
jgi:AcrR family transcriptional regulator